MPHICSISVGCMSSVIGPEAARDEIGAALDAATRSCPAAGRVLGCGGQRVPGRGRRTAGGPKQGQPRIDVSVLRRDREPPDGPDDPALPAGTVMCELLWQRLRITPGEVRRRLRIAARISPRRSLTGPVLPPELPHLAAAVEDGDIDDDHIDAVCKALDLLPYVVPAAQRAKPNGDGRPRPDSGRPVRHRHRAPHRRGAEPRRALRRPRPRPPPRPDTGPQGPDGMSRLSGWLTPETRAYLEALAAAVRPGRHHPDQTAPSWTPRPTPEAAPTPARRRQTRAEGRHRLRQLGHHRGMPVTVIATTTLASSNQPPTRSTTPPSRCRPGAHRRRLGPADARPDRDGRRRHPLPGGVRRSHRPAALPRPHQTHRHRRPTHHLLTRATAAVPDPTAPHPAITAK